MDPIERVFALLDAWRHLPKYQLERRADIFFALYLREFLADRLSVELCEELVPEFPIHLRTIGRPARGEECCNVDFVALARDFSFALFVELKTDSLSRRHEQDEYLRAAQSVGFTALLNGAVQIAVATKHKRKYLHLLLLLDRIGVLQLPEAVRGRTGRSSLRGITRELKDVRVVRDVPQIRVLYLQPAKTEPDSIGFDDLAQWLQQWRDPLSERFARSLAHWSIVIPGEAR